MSSLEHYVKVKAAKERATIAAQEVTWALIRAKFQREACKDAQWEAQQEAKRH